MKKILVLLFNNFANDSRVLKECTTLVDAGYGVELWAYHDPKLPELETVSGFVVRRKFYKQPKALPSPKRIKGVLKRTRKAVLSAPVRALRAYPGVYRGVKAAFNAVERKALWFAQRARSNYFQRKQVGQVEKYKDFAFDIIHCNDLAPLAMAVAIKKQHPRVRIVYDSHEHQTETPKLNVLPEKKKHFQDLERECIAFADEVITVSPSIAADYESMYGLPKVHVIKNCPTLMTDGRRGNYLRETFGLKEDDFVFLYQGALKASRGVGDVLDCFSALWAEGYAKHHVVFMGYGPFEAEIRARAGKVPTIHFHAAVPSRDVPPITASADYGLIFTPNTCKNHDYSLPNKLFEYMSCGLPIIASPLREMKQLIEAEEIGRVTENFTVRSLVDALKAVTGKPDERARGHLRNLHRRKYNWDVEKRTLLELYKKVAEQPREA